VEAVPGDVARLETRPWLWVRPALVSCRLRGGLMADLPARVDPGAWAQVATLRPEARAPGGWVRRPWRAGPEGFHIPAGTDLGDLVTVTVDRPIVVPSDTPAGTSGSVSAAAGGGEALVVGATWCGYVHAVEPASLVVRGPYDGLLAAHGAATQALVSHRHQPAHRGRGPGRRLPVEAPSPASVTVTVDGPSVTVGDPAYGWLTVPTTRLLAAMAVPADDLRVLLRPHVGVLLERTAQATLAALAAARVPDRLPDIHQAPGAAPAVSGWVPDVSFADRPVGPDTRPAWAGPPADLAEPGPGQPFLLGPAGGL
jgi:hypothetical protein